MTIQDFFDLMLYFIRVDLIIGFGWYSIIFFILKWCSVKKEILIDFDSHACKTVVFLGISYVVIWLLASMENYFFELDAEGKILYAQRLTGPYSFGLWFQPLFWLMLTQLLRIRFVNRFLLFRILIVIPFILTFERFVIIYTSYCRDYLPSSWYYGFTWMELLVSIPIKAAEFVIIVFIYKFIKQQFPKMKYAKD